MTQQCKHNRISKHSKMIIADTRDSLSYSISCFLTRLQTRKRAKRMCGDNLWSFSVAFTSKKRNNKRSDVPVSSEHCWRIGGVHVEAVVHPQNGKTRLEESIKDIWSSQASGHAGRSSATGCPPSASTSIKYVRNDTAFFLFCLEWAHRTQIRRLKITDSFARTQSKELEKLSDTLGMVEKSIRRPMQLAYLPVGGPPVGRTPEHRNSSRSHRKKAIQLDDATVNSAWKMSNFSFVRSSSNVRFTY